MNPTVQAMPGSVPLRELDRRYFNYAAALPAPLDTLALDRQLFIGKGQSQPISSLGDVHPLATCIPWLFKDAFPAVTEADIFDISEAGTLLIVGLLLQDPYLDGQLPTHPGLPLLHQHLNSAALRKFQGLFPGQSPFWAYYDQYLTQYTTALLQEMTHRGQVTAYSIETMYQIGSGKIALFKTVTTALALKASAAGDIAQLEVAVDALGAAMQLADDIDDWAEDYRDKNYTLPLTCIIPADQWPVPNLSVDEIARELENSLVLVTLIKQVVDWFNDAQDAVRDLSCPGWIEFVGNYLARTEQFQQALVAKKLLKIMS